MAMKGCLRFADVRQSTSSGSAGCRVALSASASRANRTHSSGSSIDRALSSLSAT
jgi:hypothetical protein